MVMRTSVSLLLLGVFASQSHGLFSYFHPSSWNGLRATWGLNPFSGWNFDKLPRDIPAAVKEDFVKIDSQCQSSDQSFRGIRYMYKTDPNVLLLFDSGAKGYIAGIQLRIPKDQYTPSSQTGSKAYIEDTADGVAFWTLTTYFVDPATICGKGRTEAEFEEQGTGTGLYIQNGTTPSDVFHVPGKEEDMKKLGTWGAGKCFPSMGKHYWFNIREDMTADEFFPYCLLYNNGKLDAFCFASNTYYDGSDRFEHPGSKDADRCCINAPKFFFDAKHKDQKQTTMHVFLNNSPRTGWC